MYDDIINLQRPKSSHKKMSITERAAQFSSFQALTGYEDMINESQRLTDTKKYLREDELLILNNRLNYLAQNISKKPLIQLTYFIKDTKKKGGKYQDIEGIINKIDFYNKTIKINNIIISFQDIFKIEGEIFNNKD